MARSIISDVNALSGSSRIPVTAENLDLLEHWMANEGGLWANNPLNTSLDASRYPHQFNGSQDTGIPIYPSITVGEEDTARTLVDNGAYAHILAALRKGTASCTAFGTAVENSPWASSHYAYDPSRFCGGPITTISDSQTQLRGHHHVRHPHRRRR
ncbi:MAG: hypothetical protein ACRDV4_10560 [Acidimicrobiales bacterium]